MCPVPGVESCDWYGRIGSQGARRLANLIATKLTPSYKSSSALERTGCSRCGSTLQEEVVRQVGLRCSSERLTPPSRKAILARVRALDTREVAKPRLQASEAAALVDQVPGNDRVDNALDAVQIDHTPVDVIVVNEANRLPIGRRWLTLAIDVATRVVVGFFVSLEAPSSTSVALCLAQAVLRQTPVLRWLLDFKNEVQHRRHCRV